MNEQIIIRSARLEDIDVIIGLKIKMFEDAGLINLLDENCYDLIYKKYSKLYKSKKAIHYLIEVNGQVVSIAGGFLKDDIPYCFYKERRYGFIGDMYTEREFRMKGYSKLLLAKVIDWLKQQGISQIQLLASEAGKHMYEKIGFTINEASMTYYLQ